jgi:curli biogenesis system outer membrane secretion channel CsgG
MRRSRTPLVILALLLLAACAPRATPIAEPAMIPLADVPCQSDPAPVVAVLEFDNTTSQYGTNVTGVEEAATARLITLLKESGCYEVVERSVLQQLIAQQGLESLAPEALARAAGAGYVVTGVVTRATIARPQVSAFGVTLGQTGARVEVDVRATDIITGQVVVSMTGVGMAESPNIAITRIPAGTISYDDPTVGPLLARASSEAIQDVVAALRTRF